MIWKLGANGYRQYIARLVVEEGALLDAREQKKIGGAALDVFATEPNIDPRFLALDDIALAPRNASIMHETCAAMVVRLLFDVEAFLNGRLQCGGDDEKGSELIPSRR